MAFKGVDIELIDPQANTEQAREEEQEVDEEKQKKRGGTTYRDQTRGS